MNLLRAVVPLLLLVASSALPIISVPASPAHAENPVDLAAMALSPDDLDAIGLIGFGQRESAMLSLAEQADQVAPALVSDPDALRLSLAQAGFTRRYQRELGLPQRPDGASSRLESFVTSYLLEYSSAEGAAAGFALLEAESPEARSQDIPGTQIFGERSEITRLRDATASGEPYRALDLTFQRGALVAGVTIGAFGGREPDPMVAESLAARLLAKIDADSGPGLSNLVVRLGGPDVETRSDEYGRLDGVTYPNYAETAGEFADRLARYGDAVDIYGVGQSVATGRPARTDDVRFLVLLYRFASDEAAAAWLADSAARTLQVPNVIDATIVDDAASLGEESLTLAVTTERSSAGLARGYLIGARVGKQVAQVQLLGFPDAPLRAVEDLALVQVACLQDGACLDGAAPPESLLSMAAATPAAQLASDLCATTSNGVEAGPLEPAVPQSAATPDHEAREQTRPNIVVILTDDLDARSVGCMPHVQRMLAEAGATFSNAFVTTPLCCPSRASILRGQYAHNHGVLNNSGADGGFPAFYALGDEDSTIATWLQDAGYRTALFGKYLNRYPRGASVTHVPPGWDEWAAFASTGEDGEGGAYFSDYTLNENGVLVSYRHAEADYSTDVLAAMGIDFVERAAASGQPFFLLLTPFAPHGPSTPAARHSEAFAGAAAPRVPSFAEADVSDKPSWVRASPPLDADDVALIDDRYQRRLRSLLAVDEMVASLVETLDAAGELDTTTIIFTSDNGFHLGEHRLPLGKQTAYDESIRVPLFVRGPGVPAGLTVDQFALNIDLAPTFTELAGEAVPDFVDGRSLVPLLVGETPGAWREGFLVERFARARSDERMRAAVPEATPHPSWEDDPEEDEPGISPIDAPPYAALRTDRYLYVEYDDGQRELYDLQADPYQLQNLASSADPLLLADLAAELERLRACAGVSCGGGGGEGERTDGAFRSPSPPPPPSPPTKSVRPAG